MLTNITTNQTAIRIYYGHTDAAGIVFHANYLHFADQGRTEMLRALNYDVTRQDIVLAVVNINIQFHASAHLDDLITVTSTIKQIGGASMEVVQQISRDDKPLCELTVTLVAIGEAKHAVPIPQMLRQLELDSHA